MGCDIHVKTFAFSKVENRMVPLSSAFADGEYWTPVVGDRDYDLFGLFGNGARSWYPELDCFEDGEVPDFVKGTAFEKTVMDCDYHTRRWCYAGKLKAALVEYRNALFDPVKWKRKYADVADEPLFGVHVVPADPKEWMDRNDGLIGSIDGVLKRISELEDFVRDTGVFDLDTLAFATWMDS